MSQPTTVSENRFRWGRGGVRPALLTLVFTLSLPLHAADEDAWDPNKIIGSKHDRTNLNQRAGVEAMEGIAYTKLENACVYCHIPENKIGDASRPGQIEGWNRLRPVTSKYQLYQSLTYDSNSRTPNDISLLCLSCHDGGMTVDKVVNRDNNWSSGEEQTLHMKLSGNNDLESCGKCHDGKTAHTISTKHIGTNITNDHPISIRYAGLDTQIKGFRTADGLHGFDSGVKLFNGFIECATCHDVHNPDAKMLLREESATICSTCHTN